jgi:hypothetical protein
MYSAGEGVYNLLLNANPCAPRDLFVEMAYTAVGGGMFVGSIGDTSVTMTPHANSDTEYSLSVS